MFFYVAASPQGALSATAPRARKAKDRTHRATACARRKESTSRKKKPKTKAGRCWLACPQHASERISNQVWRPYTKTKVKPNT